jgi:hypothetical protein
MEATLDKGIRKKTKGEGKGLALLYNHQKTETLNT